MPSPLDCLARTWALGLLRLVKCSAGLHQGAATVGGCSGGGGSDGGGHRAGQQPHFCRIELEEDVFRLIMGGLYSPGRRTGATSDACSNNGGGTLVQRWPNQCTTCWFGCCMQPTLGQELLHN